MVKTVEDCYKTLGIFHSKFPTIPGKFKDYISTPKLITINLFIQLLLGQKKIELKFKSEHTR